MSYFCYSFSMFRNSFMVQCNFYDILKTVIIIIFWIIVVFFAFDWFKKIYAWSTWPEAYFITLVMLSISMIRHKTTTIHRLCQTFFISIQKQIEKFLNGFICIFADHNFYVITLSMHCTFFITISWWHEFRFHSQVRFPLVKFFF